MTERLFRDDGGAAVERAARLQEENAQLRQQLVYERSQRQATTLRKPRGGALGLVLVGIVALFMLGLVGGMVAVFVGRSPSAPPPPPVVVVPDEPASLPDPSTGGIPFDRTAAATALGTAQIESCKRPEGPTGSGHIKVTFANDGSVSAVVLDAGPFNGTLAGTCIENRFRLARVPTFSGPPVTVGKSFTIN